MYFLQHWKVHVKIRRSGRKAVFMWSAVATTQAPSAGESADTSSTFRNDVTKQLL